VTAEFDESGAAKETCRLAHILSAILLTAILIIL
jgi:hypothetical protein